MAPRGDPAPVPRPAPPVVMRTKCLVHRLVTQVPGWVTSVGLGEGYASLLPVVINGDCLVAFRLRWIEN